jgi:hypothetical protein
MATTIKINMTPAILDAVGTGSEIESLPPQVWLELAVAAALQRAIALRDGGETTEKRER